ncbi:MAG: PQQ-dependent sugar dehydrogenase [Alphaproteobacteria bacterium]|nr:PQQ-dependent sugar dehydrogenase [Alphaproteobacteria bacterium]
MLLLTLLACKGDDATPTDDTAPVVDTQPVAVPLDVACQLVEDGYGPAGAVEVDVEVVTSGLTIPWGVAFLPDGAMLITERDGLLRRVEADGTLAGTPVATVAVSASGEGGLLGIALDPEFESNRAFYLYYTSDDGGSHNQVERWTLAESGLAASADRVILDDIPAGLYHNGGRLRFGPEGALYVTTGDARTPGNSQDMGTLAGKILRVEPDGSVPADNPDPSSPVYVSGVRNSQGIDWRDDGRMVITDHGPSGELGRTGHDEINVAEPGFNLGWPEVYRCDEGEGLHPPSMTWQNAMPPGGHAIYRGTEIPEWQGDVIIGVMGFNSPNQPHLHRITLSDDGNVTLSETYLRGEYGRLRDVLMGPDGGLYVTTSNCDGRGTCGTGDLLLRVGRR